MSTEQHTLTRDIFGLAPGETAPPPSPAPVPPWARLISRLMYERTRSWANALDGRKAEHEVCCVPVWWQIAEEIPDRHWESGVLAVESDGLFAFLRRPTHPLEAVVRLRVEVEVAAVVTVATEHDLGTPLSYPLGPWAVWSKRVSLSSLTRGQVSDGPRQDPPAAVLDPWTQVVALAVAEHVIPAQHRAAVLRALDEQTDPPMPG